ncbi:MAG: hypothetical protein KIT87_19290 [Anaerolineae bacterium]|nr:hypothetical protein [Anaerolineae bacterium]
MTMTITLQLTPEMEARLQMGILRQDESAVREVLIEAVEPTVESLLTHETEDLSDEEFDRLSEELVVAVSGNLPSDWKGLSDYAMSRESMYEDYP